MTCVEELPSLQTELVAPLSDTAFNPLGIHVGDDVRFAISTAVDTGITFPMLIDYDSVILRRYQRYGEGIVVFPLGYLLTKTLAVDSIYTVDEPTIESLTTTIEGLLE